MNQWKGVLKLHWYDIRFSYSIFWAIFLTISTLMIIAAHMFTSVNIYVGGHIAVLIYLLIHSLLSLRETFPYALGMGSTRRMYMALTVVSFIGLAAFTALLQQIIPMIGGSIYLIITSKDAYPVHFSFIPEDVGFVSKLWIDFCLAFTLIVFTWFFSSIYYRFGKLLTLVLVVFLVLLSMFPPVREALHQLFLFMIENDWTKILSLWFPLISFVLLLITFGILRKCPIKGA